MSVNLIRFACEIFLLTFSPTKEGWFVKQSLKSRFVNVQNFLD